LGSPRGWEGTSRLVVWLGGALEVQVWIRRGIVGAKSMTLVQHTPDTDRKYPQMHPGFPTFQKIWAQILSGCFPAPPGPCSNGSHGRTGMVCWLGIPGVSHGMDSMDLRTEH